MPTPGLKLPQVPLHFHSQNGDLCCTLLCQSAVLLKTRLINTVVCIVALKTCWRTVANCGIWVGKSVIIWPGSKYSFCVLFTGSSNFFCVGPSAQVHRARAMTDEAIWFCILQRSKCICKNTRISKLFEIW